jgi:type II secretion system protein J
MNTRCSSGNWFYASRGLRSILPLRSSRRPGGFTLIELMIAIGILSLVLAAIYSSWTAILRSSKVGLDAAASVQRARIAIRTIEDSLGSAQSFVRNAPYYGFIGENGDEASLSFVARLAKSFPRSGKFGDLDVRRLTFSVETGSDSSRQLVLRQNPLLMDLDIDEKEHPLVLAKNVKEFQVQFWDMRLNDWTDEWTQTNQLPKLVMVSLKLADTMRAAKAQEEITRIVSIPANAVQPVWQMSTMPPGQGGTNNPIPNPNPNPLGKGGVQFSR